MVTRPFLLMVIVRMQLGFKDMKLALRVPLPLMP
uniref:Uncharacterized protein n=1 Tax=Picea glauca TaxID=3330 RepID=A0A117NHC0_PICGL|nr:hypothetical protein ABT39_MTgene5138 [Picea glauca]QHR86429.1 hypothetical protein Q903MT_gene428 [Picea sitchensis]